MPPQEEKWEISNRDLALFFGSLFVALLVMLGGSAGWFDPMTGGIAVVTMVAFFAMGQWLEARGVFSSGMAMVWTVFGLGVVAILAGLIHRGIIPLFVYTSASPLFVEFTNALLWGLLITAIIAVALAVYVFYFKKGVPLGAKKKTTQ